MPSTSTSSAPDLPRYADLPASPGAPPRSSWGLWGAEDRLGTLNLLGPEATRRAAASVRTHEAFPLDLALTAIDPPLFGRSRLRHDVRETVSGNEDELHDWNPQGSSQWDGFRHVRHPEHGYYNGLPSEAHGVGCWAERGIVGRGVLVDVDRWRREQGRPVDHLGPEGIPVADLDAALQAQGVAVRPGDVLLVRTGWLTAYRGLTGDQRVDVAAARVPEACGLASSPETAAYLWDLHVAAAATDSPGFESMPPRPGAFLHFDLVALLGLVIGELFDLDALASACAADGRYDAMFVSCPLAVEGGVASPACAIAIK